MSEMSSTLLELRDASFGYGKHTVVKRVSFSIERGTISALLGRNASGKTTLIRGCLGLCKPRSGHVLRARPAGKELRIGYVPQRETLDPIFPVSVFEVVAMGLARTFRPFALYSEDVESIRKALEAVGLLECEHDRLATLSGGQRQRALIARALVSDPHLLLLDEPTSGVDRNAERLILDLLRALATERELGVLLVSHHVAALRECVDQVFQLREGQVLTSRGPQSLEAYEDESPRAGVRS